MLELAVLTEDTPVYNARFKELRENMMNEMMHIAENADSSPFHLIGHLFLFLDYLTRSAAGLKVTTGSKLKDFYIQEALQYIEHNFHNNISVEDIAEICGLNRSYFGKIFKETIGKTPQDFILSFRMAKSAELLKFTNMSIGDIGNAVGYENQLHFSRAFKHIYGLPPREWRNQNKFSLNR